jgi:hypothetical protein
VQERWRTLSDQCEEIAQEMAPHTDALSDEMSEIEDQQFSRGNNRAPDEAERRQQL